MILVHVAQVRNIKIAMENKTKIIGVTGHPASGKDTVADYFVLKGFVNVSGGDLLREKMKKLGLPVDRASVYTFVTEMRAKYGNNYPYEKDIMDSLKGNVVVSGFRNTEELKVFKEKFGDEFTLIAVEALPEVRYMRAKGRDRVGDNISLEAFKEQEEREKNNNSGTHEVDKLISLADIKIENNGTKDELLDKLDKIFGEI